MKKIIKVTFGLFLSLASYGQYCTKTLQDGFSVYATRFRLVSIDNSSGDSNYADFTANSTNLTLNTAYTATIDNVGGAGQNGRVYIDWNQDNDFADANETITFATGAGGQTSLTINVPASATLGSTRLRLVVSWNGNPSGTSACDPSGTAGNRIGDVEDYTVVVGNPLPIELGYFRAAAQANMQVKLAWQTITETNNDYFTIERSKNAIDWEAIAKVKAAGNSTTPLFYTYTDLAPYSEQSYYRLKQTDFDGTFSYASIQAIRISTEENKVKVYPNPTHQYVSLTGKPEELNTLEIVNMFGQRLTPFVTIIRESNAMVKLDFSGLPKGMYFIKTKSTVHKVYVQ